MHYSTMIHYMLPNIYGYYKYNTCIWILNADVWMNRIDYKTPHTYRCLFIHEPKIHAAQKTAFSTNDAKEMR